MVINGYVGFRAGADCVLALARPIGGQDGGRATFRVACVGLRVGSNGRGVLRFSVGSAPANGAAFGLVAPGGSGELGLVVGSIRCARQSR